MLMQVNQRSNNLILPILSHNDPYYLNNQLEGTFEPIRITVLFRDFVTPLKSTQVRII